MRPSQPRDRPRRRGRRDGSGGARNVAPRQGAIASLLLLPALLRFRAGRGRPRPPAPPSRRRARIATFYVTAYVRASARVRARGWVGRASTCGFAASSSVSGQEGSRSGCQAERGEWQAGQAGRRRRWPALAALGRPLRRIPPTTYLPRQIDRPQGSPGPPTCRGGCGQGGRSRERPCSCARYGGSRSWTHACPQARGGEGDAVPATRRGPPHLTAPRQVWDSFVRARRAMGAGRCA